MKKSTADLLAYEFAKANYGITGLNFHTDNAKIIADFIVALSTEFQDKLGEPNLDVVKRFESLSS